MENYTFCEKITPKRPVKRPIIRSQKYRICNHNFFSRFSINGWTEFVSAYIPAKSALSLLSLRHKIVGLHTFLRNGWFMIVKGKLATFLACWGRKQKIRPKLTHSKPCNKIDPTKILTPVISTWLLVMPLLTSAGEAMHWIFKNA